MNVIPALIDLWNGMNGHKFNTGAMTIVLSFIIQQLNVDHDQSISLATYIVQGIGAVIMVVGYVHKLIKGAGK